METSSALERPIAATALLLPYNGSTANIDNGRALAQAIVDTVREPLLVLDKDLRVVTASRSFYLKFRMSRQDVQARVVYQRHALAVSIRHRRPFALFGPPMTLAAKPFDI